MTWRRRFQLSLSGIFYDRRKGPGLQQQQQQSTENRIERDQRRSEVSRVVEEEEGEEERGKNLMDWRRLDYVK